MQDSISRRTLGAAVSGAAIAAVGATSASAQVSRRLDLEDPKVRAMTRAKVMGSLAKETVYKFARLHIYGYMNSGNLIPFFSLNNLNISDWERLPNGNYGSRTVESGVYCKFDTDEPIDTWVNPVTGATREVWHFRSGPFTTEIGPEGVVTKGAKLQPNTLRMEVLGKMVFIPTDARMVRPHPMKPAVWPTQSGGPTFHWDSQSTQAARVADVLNPDIASADAFTSFQNMVSFHPWFGMGARPGRTYGKAHGTKFSSLSQIPAAALKGFEQKTPTVFDHKNWKEQANDIESWMAAHTPG